MKIQTLFAGAFSAALMFGSLGASAVEVPAYHRNAKLECASCHTPEVAREGRTPSKTECVACHNEDALVKKSAERLGARNPHESIHFHRDMPCEDCHRQHKAPVNQCTEMCHVFPEMKFPANS
ncbi:cytochrome c3 family protein [Sutterella megalosphaeroides]|uniref:Cytochrome c n=1 Tax=Sutterella megalosphaeroides TaxID=2494234 RepID=A0A2Z6IDW2_9BURK|nr:cytochrome c3 family protein [Sutterella megalosphaeroides]BBF23797.1 cytochrome c [Sutterella megalosphaeroides]